MNSKTPDFDLTLADAAEIKRLTEEVERLEGLLRDALDLNDWFRRALVEIYNFKFWTILIGRGEQYVRLLDAEPVKEIALHALAENEQVTLADGTKVLRKRQRPVSEDGE